MAAYTAREVLDYKIGKLKAAGIKTTYGYQSPVLGRTAQKDNKPFAEIWLTNPVYLMSENAEYPYQCDATIELYVVRYANSSAEAGEWYDTVTDAVNALAQNTETRSNRNRLWWDSEGLSCDTNSPLKRWDGSLENSPGFLVVLIELPIHFLTTVPA